MPQFGYMVVCTYSYALVQHWKTTSDASLTMLLYFSVQSQYQFNPLTNVLQSFSTIFLCLLSLWPLRPCFECNSCKEYLLFINWKDSYWYWFKIFKTSPTLVNMYFCIQNLCVLFFCDQPIPFWTSLPIIKDYCRYCR